MEALEASRKGVSAGSPKKTSAKVRESTTAISLVTKHVIWPHKDVYATDGKAAVYDKISMALFVQGYLIIIIIIIIMEEKE